MNLAEIPWCSYLEFDVRDLRRIARCFELIGREQ